MEEKRYILYNRNSIVARYMRLEDALLLIQAYCEQYFNETVSLTLEEEGIGECETKGE